MHVAMIVKKLLHYRGADKSLSGQEGNKLRLSQFVMGRGMVRFGYGRDRSWNLVNKVMNLYFP